MLTGNSGNGAASSVTVSADSTASVTDTVDGVLSLVSGGSLSNSGGVIVSSGSTSGSSGAVVVNTGSTSTGSTGAISVMKGASAGITSGGGYVGERPAL